jgi:hypothetical protein
MIDLQLLGGAEIARRLDRFAPRLAEELTGSVAGLALRLTRTIQQNKLSGQVLKAATGRLQRSIGQVIGQDGDTVTASVSIPGRYAAAQEFGFHGIVPVRQHLRQIRQAFGRSIAPKTIAVKAHPMRMNLPERSFLRSALADLEASGAIRAEIAAGIGRAKP